MANIIAYKKKFYPEGAGGGGGGSDVEANPTDPATDTLNTIGIDGTVYNIEGSGGGSSSVVYVEKQLYKATADSFMDISVAWNWEDYDFYIFAIHDTCLTTSYKQSGDTSVLTYAQIKDLIDNNLGQYFYRADGKYDNYHFSNSTITATSRDGVFFITEIVGIKTSGDYYSPIIYSTEEREIGVWTDNKPLYQKTIITNNPSINTDENISVSDLNIDTLVDIEGRYTRVATWASLEFAYEFNCYEANQYNSYLRYSITNDEIQYAIRLGANETTTYQAFTIQYTKTTDTAGSGSYNTLGVPMVHYTTDEQVIGTWIDGKPLYKKVIEFASVETFSRNTDKDITSLADFSSVKQPISCIGVYDGTSEERTTPMTIFKYNNKVYAQTYITIALNKLILEYTKTTDV